jgi:hypothetical protein
VRRPCAPSQLHPPRCACSAPSAQQSAAAQRQQQEVTGTHCERRWLAFKPKIVLKTQAFHYITNLLALASRCSPAHPCPDASPPRP